MEKSDEREKQKKGEHAWLREWPRVNPCQARGMAARILIKSALEQLHRAAPSASRRLATITPNVESKVAPYDIRGRDEIGGRSSSRTERFNHDSVEARGVLASVPR